MGLSGIWVSARGIRSIVPISWPLLALDSSFPQGLESRLFLQGLPATRVNFIVSLELLQAGILRGRTPLGMWL